MLVYRFCSFEEFKKLDAHENLVHEGKDYDRFYYVPVPDYLLEINGLNSVLSKIFKDIRRFLGIVTPDVLVILQVNDTILRKEFANYNYFGKPKEFIEYTTEKLNKENYRLLSAFLIESKGKTLVEKSYDLMYECIYGDITERYKRVLIDKDTLK